MKRSAILLMGVVLVLAACSVADAPSEVTPIAETIEEAASADEEVPAEAVAPSPSAVEAEEEDNDSVGTFLFVLGRGFISPIYTIARRDLEEAGYNVVVASYTLEPLRGYSTTRTVTADVLLEDTHMEDYDALIFISDYDLSVYNRDPDAARLAREALEQGKMIGTIRTSQFILAQAGLLEGVEITAHGSYRGRLEAAFGAIWIPVYVHRDGQFVTAAELEHADELVAVMLEAMEEAQ